MSGGNMKERLTFEGCENSECVYMFMHVCVRVESLV